MPFSHPVVERDLEEKWLHLVFSALSFPASQRDTGRNVCGGNRYPLELFNDVAWDTYCPVAKLGEHIGETVVTCGLVVEQRTHHQVTGEPMKFLTLGDWTGMVETELFSQTYKSYGLATVRYPVLEVTATVEPFENGRGFSLRVLRAGKPRTATERVSLGAGANVLHKEPALWKCSVQFPSVL